MSKKDLKSPIQVVREVKVIAEEFTQTCFKTGEAQFQLRNKNKEIKGLTDQLSALYKRQDELAEEHHLAVKNIDRKNQEAADEKAKEDAQQVVAPA